MGGLIFSNFGESCTESDQIFVNGDRMLRILSRCLSVVSIFSCSGNILRSPARFFSGDEIIADSRENFRSVVSFFRDRRSFFRLTRFFQCPAKSLVRASIFFNLNSVEPNARMLSTPNGSITTAVSDTL